MATDSDNQYAPPKSVVADVGADEGSNRASRLARLGAACIDGLIWMIGFIPTYFIFITSIAKSAMQKPATNALQIWWQFAQTGAWFYVGVLWSLLILAVNLYLMYTYGQSIGKRLVGIKMVRPDGTRASLLRLFLVRYVANTAITMVPGAGGLYSLVDILMIFGKERRCVHDYLADTIVIDA